jgi:hypothetical protein
LETVIADTPSSRAMLVRVTRFPPELMPALDFLRSISSMIHYFNVKNISLKYSFGGGS